MTDDNVAPGQLRQWHESSGHGIMLVIERTKTYRPNDYWVTRSADNGFQTEILGTQCILDQTQRIA